MGFFRTTVFTVVLGCLAAQGQEFEAASVKPAGPFVPGADDRMRGGPGSDDPGRITYPRVSLFRLASKAYDVADDRVVAPDWMNQTWFNVTAKIPEKTNAADFRGMLRHLLVQRFHLALHHDTKPAPGYDLVVASGGAKLHPSPAEDTKWEVDGFPTLLPGRNSATVITTGGATVRSTYRITMAELADSLGRAIMLNEGAYGDSLGGIPGAMPVAPRVADKTGLTGKFDFTWEYGLPTLRRRASAEASDPGGGPTVFFALEKQLGLKLVKAPSRPVDILVIDHADKVPTGN